MQHAFDFLMLGLESASVMQKRLAKIALGGTQSADEIQLMFAEKADASREAMIALTFGGTLSGTVARFREHVAANEARLSTSNAMQAAR